ncbi:MAG TPA: glycosyltransferase family 39 protein, partial [Phycisphaerae bacterium]|nr:glycosyltransferase family 39 protein [Phycisphaerae bacterium]
MPLGGPDVLCAAIILLAVLVVGAPGITQGGLGWSDAPQHTFDGIFVLEFFKQWPVHGFRAWAEQFYLKCPALGIFVYWPPGFAVVEAVFFALFGVSIVAARAVVLLYAIAAGLLMFALGRRWFDRPTGLLASLLLITCAHGALWLNDVMLEWPTTCWILAAVYAYQVDRDTRRARWAVVLGVTIVMA